MIIIVIIIIIIIIIIINIIIIIIACQYSYHNLTLCIFFKTINIIVLQVSFTSIHNSGFAMQMLNLLKLVIK